MQTNSGMTPSYGTDSFPDREGSRYLSRSGTVAEHDFLSPASLVKKYTFVTRSALYAAMKDGLLPFYRLPSRKGARGKYLIKESEFLAWLEGNRHEADTEGNEAFERHRR